MKDLANPAGPLAPACMHDSQKIYKTGEGCNLKCNECGEEFGRIDGTGPSTNLTQAMFILRNQTRMLPQSPSTKGLYKAEENG